MRDFIDLAIAVEGDPLANVLAVLEIARAHDGAIFSIPLPITMEFAGFH